MISRVISGVTILITHIRGLITPLITTHEPPSRVLESLTSGLEAICMQPRSSNAFPELYLEVQG